MIIRNTKSYTIKDFYNFYTDNIDNNPLYSIEYSIYKQIVLEYFQYIKSQIMYNSKEFKFPYRIGSLQIVKHQPKNLDSRSLRVDYGESKKQGKLIYHLNEHSNYYKFRYYWSKIEMLIPNRSKYQFVASRANKRELAQIIKNNERDYQTI